MGTYHVEWLSVVPKVYLYQQMNAIDAAEYHQKHSVIRRYSINVDVFVELPIKSSAFDEIQISYRIFHVSSLQEKNTLGLSMTVWSCCIEPYSSLSIASLIQHPFTMLNMLCETTKLNQI